MIGKRIKELRKEKGLTQQQLGKLINVTKVSICCYEKETRTPTLETLLQLARLFNKDVNYFLGNDEFVISDNNDNYGMSMSSEEIEFIKEVRKYNNLHRLIINDPKRIVELIDKKIG